MHLQATLCTQRPASSAESLKSLLYHAKSKINRPQLVVAAQVQTSGLDSGNAVSLISLLLLLKFQLQNIYLWDEGKEKLSILLHLCLK